MVAIILSKNFVSAKKVKVYDSCEHALKGNDNKLIVTEFLSTLGSVTSWLDIKSDTSVQITVFKN